MSSTLYGDSAGAAYWPALDAAVSPSTATSVSYIGHTALSDASVCSPATSNPDSDVDFTAADTGKCAGKLSAEVL